jgi:AraC-like DNA-binding protein
MIVNNIRKVLNLENKGFVGYINNLFYMYPQVIHKLRITCGYVDFFIYSYKHYREKIYLQDIADFLGISPSYLSRLFKKETGIPPSKYK